MAPDLYVLPGVDPGLDFGAWKVWETGIVPSFALEIVSTNVMKDYEDSPRRYAELGVAELIVFDPLYAAAHRRRGPELEPERCRWQVFRKIGQRGFSLIERSNTDRVRSKVLGCWLRDVAGQGPGSPGRAAPSRQLRLAVGPRGDELVPTEAEAETLRRQDAEAEVTRLRAELERLRRGR